MKNKVAIIIVLLVILGAATAWRMSHAPSSSAVKMPHFNLVLNTWVGYGPFWLAQEKGFFKEEGIDVNIATSDDPAQRKAAVLKGEVDGVADTVDLLVLARDQSVPSIAVSQLDVSLGADGILVTEAIKKVEDLKGKRIAVQKNFVSEALLQYVLERHGMSLKDVEVVDMEAGAAGAAFVAGQIDIAVTFEPWMSKAKTERPGSKVLISSADEPGVIVDILTIREAYLKDHPEEVKKVMRAWFKAVDYWSKNKDEANRIMAAHYKASPAEFADLISGLIWTNYEDQKAYFGTPDRLGRIFEVADIFSSLFLKTSTIKTKPDLKAAINQSIIHELYVR